MFQCGQRRSVTIGNSLAWEAIGKYVKRIVWWLLLQPFPRWGKRLLLATADYRRLPPFGQERPAVWFELSYCGVCFRLCYCSACSR